MTNKMFINITNDLKRTWIIKIADEMERNTGIKIDKENKDNEWYSTAIWTKNKFIGWEIDKTKKPDDVISEKNWVGHPVFRSEMSHSTNSFNYIKKNVNRLTETQKTDLLKGSE